MRDLTRARVAAIVASAARKKSVSAVYEYSSGRFRNISVTVDAGKVTGYDYGSDSHFSGSNGSADALDFYDHESSSHVQLHLKGKKFSGYDYHTMSHFAGTLNGNAISLFDYQTGQSYAFRVEASKPDRPRRRREP
jgi:hypothetical protein